MPRSVTQVPGIKASSLTAIDPSGKTSCWEFGQTALNSSSTCLRAQRREVSIVVRVSACNTPGGSTLGTGRGHSNP